jgi:hypothetical protein
MNEWLRAVFCGATSCSVSTAFLLGLTSSVAGQNQSQADLALTALTGRSLANSAQNRQRVQFDVTPYIWGSRIEGTVGLRGRTAEVDISFRQLLEHMEGAFMLPVEARYGKWGFGLELIYIKVGDDHATPGPLFSVADFTAKETIIEFGPRFRLIESKAVALDVLAGGRWWRLRNKLDLGAGVLPEVTLELNESWIDPFGGLRMFIDLSSRWLLQARGDLGGLGAGSDFTWQALGGLGYKFGDRYTVKAGWRQLDVDFEEDDNGFLYDVGTGGVILGLTIRF